MERDISRRSLLAATAAAILARPTLAASKLKVAIFSKHLQFLQSDALAEAASTIGFDGIDITVRKGGHVAPERVQHDLPELAATIRRHKLDVPMITTDIVDAESPYAEQILKTMSELGIRNYRWGGLKYAPNQSYAAQLESMKPRVAKLATLNEKHKVCAMYHTHSGPGQVGASIWDLYILLKDLDPDTIGVNYDIGHSTIEGGLAGWINSYRITGKYVRGIAVKDFLWEKDAKGNWQPRWKPLGDGMVRFPQFFAMVAESGFAGPLQLHFEYPLRGSENGKDVPPEARGEVLSAMKRDLATLRGYLRQAAL